MPRTKKVELTEAERAAYVARDVEVAEAVVRRNQPLTMSDLVALQTLLEAVQGNRKVAYVKDGDILYGIARSVGDEQGNFLRNDEDVRDGYLRITSRTGFEHFIAVTEVMAAAKRHEFAIYNWS